MDFKRLYLFKINFYGDIYMCLGVHILNTLNFCILLTIKATVQHKLRKFEWDNHAIKTTELGCSYGTDTFSVS